MSMFETKKEWVKYTDSEISDLVNRVFSYYRSNGFPYFSTDDKYRNNQIRSLMSYNGNLLVNDTIKQTMHGLGFLWSFHPESFAVKSNGKLSPLEAFNNDDIFRRVILKRIKIGDNLTPNGIRKMLKMFSGVQGVSNFRPTAAKAIYQNFLPDGGVTWDMSSGWGGRLLGAYSAKNIKYIGTDPSKNAQSNNRKISDYLGFKSDLLTDGSECFRPDKKSIDLCFTSPPYFDCEKYSNDVGQSYIKFTSKDEWLEGFFRETIKNCKYGLKDDGFLAINIANVPSFKNLEYCAVSIAKSEGFKHQNTIRLSLSSCIGKAGFKYEPIFIFNT